MRTRARLLALPNENTAAAIKFTPDRGSFLLRTPTNRDIEQDTAQDSKRPDVALCRKPSHFTNRGLKPPMENVGVTFPRFEAAFDVPLTM